MTDDRPVVREPGANTTVRRQSPLDALAWQASALALVAIMSCALHWHNDGLWFQGDAPRHAASGLFVWDLLAALPTDPLDYALSYYARYPVIVAGVYPPLFYLLEGLAFGAIAPSPFVAKGLVLGFLVVLGIYTLCWGRRLISPWAGWAGPCTMLLPGFVLYSNAVLLNVPSTALALGALYHLQIWLDAGRVGHRRLFVALTVAATLTYFPGAIVLPIACVWMIVGADRRLTRPFVWLALVLLVLTAVTAWAMPAHFWRNAPSVMRIVTEKPWRFYATALASIIGPAWVAAGVVGMLAGCVVARRRHAAVRLLSAAVVTTLSLAVLPAMDGRYALILGPIVVLGAFLGVLSLSDAAGRFSAVIKGIALATLLAFATRQQVTTAVPQVSGIDQVALYLRTNAPDDAVLFSGQHDGVFGFYVRALDPAYSRRVVLSGKLLYRYEQDTKFFWHETPLVSTTDDVVTLIRTECGCRWVAVEVEPASWLNASERLLRQAVQSPAFELAGSFPISGHPVSRIDLYRFLLPVSPDPPVELRFPSFSERVFTDVRPIESRR